MKKINLTLLIIILSLTGCLQSGSTEDGTIPDVRVECSQAQVYPPYCQSSGDVLWIGITSQFELDCGNVLSAPPSYQRNSHFDAIAEYVNLTQAGPLVHADVRNWSTPLGGRATSLMSGTYKVCAFIESAGGNGRLDRNEPLGAGLLTVGGSSPQLVNDWISY